jgi:hypothetical protein
VVLRYTSRRENLVTWFDLFLEAPMTRLLPVSATLSLILSVTVATYADHAPPVAKPSPAPRPKLLMSTSFAIIPDGKAPQARLEMSQESLNDLRAALASFPADPAANVADSQSLIQSISNSSSRTILAGLFLFLSLSFAGVWLARSGNARKQKLAAVVLIGTAVISAAAMITRGNVGPPPGYRWRNLSKNLNDGKPTQGSVDIVVAEGSGIRLIMPVPVKSGASPSEEE